MTRNYELNLEHERAEHALRCVTEIERIGRLKDKYSSEAKQTDTRLQTAGLLQTLAFYCSKMKDRQEDGAETNHFVYLVVHLLGYVLTATPGSISAAEAWKLYQKLLKEAGDAGQLMYYTQRAKSLTRWLTRFSTTMLEPEGE